jgi:transposase
MFVRVKTVNANDRTYQYLHVVENRREGDKVRQRIVASLGRLDELTESGDLEKIVRQLVEHCPAVRIRQAQAEDALAVTDDKLWGPVLIFERLWEELGLKELMQKISSRQRFEFNFERMAFVQVLQRLVAPGSDLAGSKWIANVQGEGFGGLRLQHFHRSLGFLWKKKKRIEEALYQRGRELFNQELDLVFFDTTSMYFEGTSLDGWAKRGKSKDHRPDHLQLVIGVVMRRDGLPVACEIWPGNKADVKTVVPIIKQLQKRFEIRKVVFVCDRGTVSRANLDALTEAKYEYIVGMKMRGLVEVRREVLGRAGRYRKVSENLRVKEVWVEDRRYVVCHNPQEAEMDRHAREALIAKLEEKLTSGGVRKLINNRGYKRFLRVTEKGAASVDLSAAKTDARYDGKYVLQTTSDLPTPEVATAYKQLMWIERLWRELKDVMALRPIYHHKKRENVKGHIFVCFVALYLAVLLRKRLAEAKEELSWDDVIRDLSQVRAITVDLEDEQYLLRSPVKGCAGRVFKAVGVRVPPMAQPV